MALNSDMALGVMETQWKQKKKHVRRDREAETHGEVGLIRD